MQMTIYTHKQPLFSDRPQKAFSLVELMVTLSIITLIASVSFPSMMAFKIRAARVEMQQNTRALSSLLAAYHADSSNYGAGIVYGAFNVNDNGLEYAFAENCMTNYLEFSATGPCSKLRFYYVVMPGSLNGGLMDAANTDKHYTITALSTATVADGGNATEFYGRPAFNTRLCRRFIAADTEFIDYWMLTQDGILSFFQNNQDYDGLKVCMDG